MVKSDTDFTNDIYRKKSVKVCSKHLKSNNDPSAVMDFLAKKGFLN